MAYKQIINVGPGGRTEKDISVTPRGITLLKGFRNKHPHTNRVALYFNDDGFLCFKFFGRMPRVASPSVTKARRVAPL